MQKQSSIENNTPRLDPGVAAGKQAQELLVALVAFIQPIIVPSSVNDRGGTRQRSENEGKKLLQALEDFVVAAVWPKRGVQAKAIDDSQPISPKNAPVDIPPKAIPDDDINWENVISGNLRKHVFNKMPIRLLTFDSTGGWLRLIEREDMYRLILKEARVGAAQTKFRARWDETHKKQPYPDREAFKRDEDKRDSLITDLVEQHAKYAILSHTWIRDTPGDVTYNDWKTRTANQRGYAKITKFCEIAAKNHGVTFGWMDTVCINKDSSSELDESIRSMYKWYRSAEVCITLLADTQTVETMRLDSWFTRGWTLQELLAPKDVQFYNVVWKNLLLGDKNNKNTTNKSRDSTVTNIREQIKQATTITEDELDLCRRGNMEKIPISRRLQLAAQRNVTREEDTAYSLMGLLGVDISVAYGEGAERAFFRLMRELLNTKKNVLDIFNRDYSIRNSDFVPSSITHYLQRSDSFDVSGKVSLLDKWKPIKPLILTHLGVRVSLLLVPGLVVDPSIVPMSDNLEVLSDLSYSAPKGDFSGEFSLYILLDRELYGDKIPTRLLPSAGRHLSTVLMFGVLNFGIDDNTILLPLNCLSVPLNCGRAKPGNVRPSDNIKIGILPTKKVPIFQLHSIKSKDRIPRNELGYHGMQLLTLYL